MTKRRTGQSYGYLLAVALVGLGAGCSDQQPEPAAEETVTSTAALSAVVAGNLAYPEYDLNVPVAGWWMHSASPATVQAKMDQGYRLHDIDVLSASPLLFTANFVSNVNVYARTGNDWDYDLTETELLAIKDDVSRRIVDITQYEVGGEQRYAAVWLDNTGSQERAYRLLLNVLEPNFVAEVNGDRVMSVARGPDTDCTGQPGCISFRTVSAVVIPNAGDDMREQTIGSATGIELKRLLLANNDACWDTNGTPCKRMAALHQDTDGTFFYVLEEAYRTTGPNNVTILAEGEQTWWAAGLYYDPLNLDHPDSIEHALTRFGGRFRSLVPYTTDAGTRYIATAISNTSSIPAAGSSNGGNAVLNEVDAIVARQLRRAGLPGLTLGIVQGGRLVHAKGYGYSDLQASRVTQPTDLFRIASVSKTIAEAAVTRLAVSEITIPAGRPGAGQPFTLDTKPWGQLFPYDAASKPWRPNLGDVSVRDLIDHRSGLRAISGTYCGCADGTGDCDVEADGVLICDPAVDPNCLGYSCNPFQWSATPQEWVDVEAALEAEVAGAAFRHHYGPNEGADPGTFAPACPASFFADPTRTAPCSGSPWQYKNAGYHMLGHVIEAVVDQEYDDYLRGAVLDPLNLERLRVGQWRQAVWAGCPEKPFSAGLFQAVNYQTPDFFREGGWFDDRGDWVLCPRDRYPASSYSASPIDLLRWATSVDGGQPGYRALGDSGWIAMGQTASHGGYLPQTTAAGLEDRLADPANGVPESLKIFWAINSDRIDRFDLSWELWNLLNAQSAGLPNRDLFDDYIDPWSPPGMFAFDTVTGWQLVSGSGSLSTSALHTEGTNSLSVSGGGYREIRSAAFYSGEAREQAPGVVPRLVTIDVYLGQNQPNQWWYGGMDMFVDIPSAGMSRVYIDHVELTGLPLGTFSSRTFDLPEVVRIALAGGHSDVQLYVAVNTPSGAPPVLLDNLRFLEECVPVQQELVTNQGFESNTNGWVGSYGTSISSSTLQAHSGARSLRVANRNIAAWQGGVYNLLGIASPGDTLQASGWVRVAGDPSEPALLTRLATCSGGSPTYQTIASGIATNNGWLYLNGTATVPNCTLTELSVYFEGPRTGIVLHVDDVSVKRPTATCQ